MNGRCENDALDGAIDVCDACGGEFCGGCLLYPNGPKKAPLCTACAISTSGVRKAAKRERVQSRSAASKRRKELRKLAAENQNHNLVVLDDLPGVDLEESEKPKSKKRRLRRKGDPKPETLEPVEPDTYDGAEILEEVDAYQEEAFVPFDFEAEAAGPDTASKLIDEIKSSGEIDQIASGGADLWNLPSDYDDPGHVPDPNDHYAIVQEPVAEIAPEPVAQALPEPPPAATPEPPPVQPAPKWETLHNPDASNPFDDPSLGLVQGQPQPRGSSPAATNSEVPVERRVNRVPAPQHRSPAPQQAAPQPQNAPQHQSAPQHQATPAPLVQPEPPEPKRRKMRDLLSGKEPTPPPPVVQPEVVQERVQNPTTDTDAAGQWIPPNLRGMVASEEQTALPKRTRRDRS